MELDVVSWMGELCRKLSERFGKRLLFAGLQGSRQRGEAREDATSTWWWFWTGWRQRT